MTPNTKNVSTIIALILIVGFISYYIGKTSQGAYVEETINAEESSTETTSSSTAPKNTGGMVATTTKTTPKTTPVSTTPSTKGFHSYSNSEYGFTIKYPPYVQARNVFSTFHEITNNWRLNASPANQGKGLLELSIFSVDQGSVINNTGKQKYPLYFISTVRVSVSPNVKECYATDPGYTNQKVTNVTINGVVFKKFSASDAAMMKYVQSESYRTIRDTTCFVLEQIKNGSNYRDEKMEAGISEPTLAGYYNTGETIIKTFTFTR